MAGTERKVLQKYYPSGFDGSKVSRIKKKSSYSMQRATVPFNMQYLPLDFLIVWQRLKSKEIYKIRIIRLKNLIEQKTSSIADDVKAQEKEDEELLDSLFGNKNEPSSTKIVEEVVGKITDSDVSSDDELRHH
uniref:Ovule protein n=1 Tax=Strongyloides venezuelensis TaxID=75913 RepID=A0A0K0FQD7_STRVS